MPEKRDVAFDEPGGRGLMLVEILSAEWGAYRKAGGKTVWVRLSPET
jgi:hypothetical protein